MEYRNDLSANYVRDILAYDSETGRLHWKTSISDKIRPGAIAGSRRGDGYIKIRINGKAYYAHRLAWLIITGSWPDHEIDHRDLNEGNNSWNNFRAATGGQNRCNRTLQSNNTSGFKGVTWHNQNKKWMAKIKIGNKDIYLGTFVNKNDAIDAYAHAVVKFHGDFARVA